MTVVLVEVATTTTSSTKVVQLLLFLMCVGSLWVPYQRGPERLLTAFAVSTSSLTMEVEAVTRALRWIASRGESDHTYHHPHRFYDFAIKNEKWNVKPRLECVNDRHPPSKTPVGVIPWTYQSGGQNKHHK